MNDPDTTIPLVRSLKWSFQWSAAIVLRHPVVVAAYVAGGILWVAIGFAAPLLGGVAGLVYSLAFIPLALLTHNEVLRGPSKLDAGTLGEGYGRVLGYFLDTLVLALIAIFSALVPVVVISLLIANGEATSGVLEAILVLVLIVAVVVATSRFALRLPARALGAPISWGEAWRLGQGNMLPLCAAPIVIAIGFALIEGMADGLFPPLLSGLVSILAVPAQVILTCAFLSVAYGQLMRTPKAPRPETA
ncbi:hypothetical protein EZH22_18325 [Xanthobacter dioxanivorans]|uniref:Uncharacterized protein n=1 Tax=Xanthobacter dioxanivorans TaxID=2528964 RepID=A0A974PKP0_9HYPH|nr:hypothetical protein [Xanthobacter dioxanivorans]QRG05076.1 hypothetical protein EZH22_18325 [Xanthobacter dioxanivorans]